MANTKKQSQLEGLTEFLETSKNFALLKYEKTTHIALEGLRKELKKNGSNIKVIKNTIFEKAVNKLSSTNQTFFDVKKKALPIKENSALLALGEDWNKGLSAFYAFIQKDKSMDFKVGLLDAQVYEGKDLKKIAQLPSKEVLLGKVIGSMKSPIARTTYAMKFNMQKLTYILNQQSQKANA